MAEPILRIKRRREEDNQEYLQLEGTAAEAYKRFCPIDTLMGMLALNENHTLMFRLRNRERSIEHSTKEMFIEYSKNNQKASHYKRVKQERANERAIRFVQNLIKGIEEPVQCNNKPLVPYFSDSEEEYEYELVRNQDPEISNPLVINTGYFHTPKKVRSKRPKPQNCYIEDEDSNSEDYYANDYPDTESSGETSSNFDESFDAFVPSESESESEDMYVDQSKHSKLKHGSQFD